MKSVKSESGYISLIVLSVVIVGAMLFTVVYQAAVSNYGYVQDSMDRLRAETEVNSMVDLVAYTFKEDLYADGDINKNEYLGLDDLVVGLDDEIEILSNNYVYKLQEYSKEDWITFIDYDTRHDESLGIVREYDVERNWDREDYVGLSEDGTKVTLPELVYFKVTFGDEDDTDLGSTVTLKVETFFDTKEIEFLYDTAGQQEYIVGVEDIPVGIETFQMYSDEENMGSTSMSILYGREIGVEIFEKDVRDAVSDTPVAREAVTFEIGRNHNVIVR